MENKQKKKNDEWANRLHEVYEDWGRYMDYKKNKLEEQFLEEAATDFKTASDLFKGIAIFVNGYTEPPSDELRRLMMAHGGVFHHYLRTGITTHMIATNLPYSKIIMYKKAQNPLPLCKPEWITDSIKAGKVLDFRKYLLYSQHTKTQPNLLNIFTKQNKLDCLQTDKTSTEKHNDKEQILDNDKSEVTISNQHVTNNISEKIQILNPDKSHIDEKENEFYNRKKEVTVTPLTKFPVNEKNRNETSDKINYLNMFEKPECAMIEEENETHNVNRNTKLDGKEKGTINIQNHIEPEKDLSSKKLAPSTERNCSKNSEFITEFYNNSRLHHISTMGAMFKEYINDLRDKSNNEFPGLEKLCAYGKTNKAESSSKSDSDSDEDMFQSNELKLKQPNVVMHIDMDCFFVSVGLRNNPDLRGKPVAVAHAKGNRMATGDEELGSMSEIASCSYEARKAGVKNGMFLGQALKLCPSLKTIRYDFEGYKEVSYALYDTVASYTLQIEAVSCDEMYVDCNKILGKSKLDSMTFANILRREIKEKTGCPVSTGFGSNKLQARLATKKAKPDGQFHLHEKNVLNYVGMLAVHDLPGVGYSTTSKLKQMGIISCLDLQQVSLLKLQKEFGKKSGEMLYNMCRGIDNSKLNVEHVRKSVSAEVNYGIRFEKDQDAITFLEKLSAEVCNRLKKVNAAGRNITLKLMVKSKEAPKETAKFMGHGLCDYFTKTKNLLSAVDDNVIITKEILSLWHQMQQVPEDIRGIGIQISRLESTKNKLNGNSTLLNFINKAKSIPKEPIPSTSTFLPSNIPETSSSNEENKKTTHLSEQIGKRDPNNSQKVNSQNGNSTVSKVQTNADDYLKKKKPFINRSAKIELPSLQEIDMAVLVELPEDIRNEILNEYKSNDAPKPSISTERKVECLKHQKPIINKQLQQVSKTEENIEADISFSQVDPEFLAGLSEDMISDVKLYCQMKKKEKELNNKKSTTVSAWNMLKTVDQERTTKVTRKRKIDKVANTTAESKVGNKKTKVTNDEIKKLNIEAVEKKIGKHEGKVPIVESKTNCHIEFENKKFFIDDDEVDENREMLITLVNCMLDLPMEQVKTQIQAWILNSEAVSGVDFLSVVTYLGLLPKKKRIEDLHIALKTMHRCVTKLGNCVWHETYKKIAEHIQHNMQLEYNCDLMLPPMGCNRCTR